MTGDLHEVLGDAAHRDPLATDALTGVPVVLRQHDVETPAHDPRLHGIGLALFDMMGITDGPLRDWYGQLMFTNDLHTRRPARACWASDHCRCSRIPAKADDRFDTQAAICLSPPIPSPLHRAITIRSVVKPQPDLKRLARALIEVAREKQREQ
jgi:hypothetical protein